MFLNLKYWCSFSFVALLVLTVLTNSGESQDTSKTKSNSIQPAANPTVQINYIPVPLVQFPISGEVIVSSSSIGQLDYPHREFFSILHHDTVRKELELSDSQIVRIDKYFESIEQLKADALETKPGLGQPIPNFSKSFITIYDEIQDVLLNHQKHRFDEIAFRLRMRRDGPVEAICGDLNGTWLNIRPEQCNGLRRKSRQLADSFAKRAVDLSEEVERKLRKSLTHDQLKELDAWLEIEFKDNFTPIDLHYWQLSDAPAEPIPSGEPTPYDGLSSGCTLFMFEPDGTLGRFGSANRRLGDSFLRLVTQNRMTHTYLGVSDAQILELNNLQKSVEEKSSEYLELVTIYSRNKQEEDERHVRKEWKELVDSFVPEIEAILVPSQIDRLRNMCEIVGVKQHGLYASLLDSPLADRLDVTPEQLRELKEHVDSLVTEIVKKSNDFETDFYSELFSDLTMSQKQMLKKRMGRPLRQIPALPCVLISQLNSEAIKRHLKDRSENENSADKNIDVNDQ